MKQIIVSVGREYGSGGRYIAELLAKKLKLIKYDSHDFKEMLIKKGVPEEKFIATDEAPRKIFVARTVGMFNNSEEDYIAHLEFNIIKELADSGKSFVVVGRCANEVLKGHKALVSVHIWADEEYRIKRIMKMDHVSEADAISIMDKKDKGRKAFYNTYSRSGWGEMKSYDLTINSAKIGIEKSVETIIAYIKNKQAAEAKGGIKEFLPASLSKKSGKVNVSKNNKRVKKSKKK